MEPPLPPEFGELEMLLASRQRPEPDADFRQRVLTAMHIARDTRQVTFFASWGWRAASIAAAVLLGLNLWLGLENAHSSNPANGLGNGALEAIVAQVRQREPDLPEPEARQLALLVLASSRLSPQPDPASLSNPLLFVKEATSWDIP